MSTPANWTTMRREQPADFYPAEFPAPRLPKQSGEFFGRNIHHGGMRVFQLGTDISLHHVSGTEGSRQWFGWEKGGPLALYRENEGAKVLDRRERDRKEPPVVLPF